MKIPDHYEFICPVKTHSGIRALDHIPIELCSLNAGKPLVVTNQDAAAKGLAKHIVSAFKDSGMTIGIYDGVGENADIGTIKKLSKLYNDKGYDSLIALGSGSVVDTVKALNIVVSGRPEDLKKSTGENGIKKPLRPFIFVPTATGTGFESTRYANIGDMMFSSCHLMPNLAVIDPRVILPESAEKVAGTAMTALAHAVDAFLSPLCSPLADTYISAAAGFISSNVSTVLRNPENRSGRLALVNASMMAGYAFSSVSPGIMHRLARSLSRFSRRTYASCIALVMPYVLGHCLASNGRDASELLLAMEGADIYARTPEKQRTRAVLNRIFSLQNELFEITGGYIPRTLADIGITGDDLNAVAEDVSSEDDSGFSDAFQILNHALDGDPVPMGKASVIKLDMGEEEPEDPGRMSQLPS